MFYGSFVLIIATVIRYSNNVNFGKNTTPAFFIRNKCDLNTIYNVAGVVKPGSINFIKGTDECSFTLTDYEHDLRVFYKGPLTNSFLEGNTIIASGCITDINKPDIFIATKVMTDHSYNSDKWLARRLEKRSLAEEEEIVYSKIKNKI
jgi:cytochrome c-type biogenesis protein CcmE